MVKATGLNIWRRGQLLWHELLQSFSISTKLFKKLLVGDTDKRTDRRRGDIISLNFQLKRSTLKYNIDFDDMMTK
jgi:hypothetical protein